jgi:hypothetical protein
MFSLVSSKFLAMRIMLYSVCLGLSKAIGFLCPPYLVMENLSVPSIPLEVLD